MSRNVKDFIGYSGRLEAMVSISCWITEIAFMIVLGWATVGVTRHLMQAITRYIDS